MENSTLKRAQKFVNDLKGGDFTYDIDDCKKIYVRVNREDEAIQEKRMGNYDNACNIYIDMLLETASNHPYNALPPGICRSLAKVLYSANEFSLALEIIFSIVKVMIKYKNSLNPDAQYVLSQAIYDFNETTDYAKNRNIDGLIDISRRFSGNKFYEPVKNATEINLEASKIRERFDL